MKVKVIFPVLFWIPSKIYSAEKKKKKHVTLNLLR